MSYKRIEVWRNPELNAITTYWFRHQESNLPHAASTVLPDGPLDADSQTEVEGWYCIDNRVGEKIQ